MTLAELPGLAGSELCLDKILFGSEINCSLHALWTSTSKRDCGELARQSHPPPACMATQI